jgi:long-chain acyl-CoA synthetase
MDFIGKQPGKKTLTSNGINTLRGHVRKNPHKIAVRNDKVSLTYAQLWQRASQLANAMLDCGIGKGDPVITYMPNCLQYAEVMIAAQMIGSPFTLGNYRLTGDEIAYQINDTHVAIVFVQTDLLAAILKIKGKIKSVRRIVVIGDSSTGGMQNYEDFLKHGSSTEPSVEVLPEDLHVMFYTSGTTGKPKGAARTMYCDYSMAVSTCLELGINNNDTFLVVAPMYGAATIGYAISTLMAGGTLFIAPAFVPEETLKLIDAYHPTFIFMVPIMYDWMLSLPKETLAKYDLSSIRLVVACGAPMHTSIFQKMVDHFKTTEIYNMLGASELGFITRISADEWLKGGKANSIGKAIFDMELKIVSKDGKEVEPGEVGLLYCRSSAIFDGYWYNEAGTQEAFLDHEWATVGDMARMDNDGYYYLVDRAKDMIVSGGTNIYPAEVEGVILQMEGIADVGVIGVPDEKWGEQVKAVVVLKPSYSVREDEIISFCKERLAGFKVPKSVDYVDSIPRSLIGKMLKKDLRKKYWEGRDVLIS